MFRLHQIDEDRAKKTEELQKSLKLGQEELKREWLKFNRYKDLYEERRVQHINEIGMVASALATHQQQLLKAKAKVARQQLHLDFSLRNLNKDPSLNIKNFNTLPSDKTNFLQSNSKFFDTISGYVPASMRNDQTKNTKQNVIEDPNILHNIYKVSQKYPVRNPSPPNSKRPFSPLKKDLPRPKNLPSSFNEE
jgi:hypothetical protein